MCYWNSNIIFDDGFLPAVLLVYFALSNGVVTSALLEKIVGMLNRIDRLS